MMSQPPLGAEVAARTSAKPAHARRRYGVQQPVCHNRRHWRRGGSRRTTGAAAPRGDRQQDHAQTAAVQSMACIASLRLDIGRHGNGRRAQSALLAPRQRACGRGSAVARGSRALDDGSGGGAFGTLKVVVRLACMGG